MPDKNKGGCLCGATRYEFSGEPIFQCNCHCLDCQKYSGTGHITAMAVPADGFVIHGPLSSFTMPGDSGKGITRHFCRRCGSHLVADGESMPGMKLIQVGTLDDPTQYWPQVSVYAARAQKWDPPFDQAPAFDELPPRG